MTYEELFNRVRADLPAEASMNIEVETWKHGQSAPETVWKIYVPSDGERLSSFYEGPTAELAYARFEAQFVRPTLAETSASVGEALPSAEPLYRCASEHCPGYAYRASEHAHPPDTCR